MEESILDVNGMIDHYGWQRSNIKWHLNKNKGKKVRCKINSWGGSVNEAIAISKLFEEHGDVVVEFIGFCASAVTWMAFGAVSIEMHEDSLWLCHKSAVPVEIYGSMNADQIEDTIKRLQNEKKSQDAIDLIIAKKYLDKCTLKGKSIKDVFDLMREERWISASDCLEWGFIDKVIPGINKTVDNEYRAFFVENCAALKLPVPPAIPNEDNTVENDTDSLVNKILNGIKSVFPSKTSASDDKNETHYKNLNNIPTMNKTFLTVNAILGVESLPENIGKIELTVEQLQKINDELSNSAANKQAVDDAVTALDSISDNVKSITGLLNKINAIKAVINFVPGSAPAGSIPPKTSQNEADKYKESKVDPVNKYFEEENN